nr:Cytochrome C oxidase assembly protein [Ipomoea batatas]
MGVASKAGDWVFRAFTAGLGVATIYLGATFSVNVYRGLKWHNAQAEHGSIYGFVNKLSQFEALCTFLVNLGTFPFKDWDAE